MTKKKNVPDEAAETQPKEAKTASETGGETSEKMAHASESKKAAREKEEAAEKKIASLESEQESLKKDLASQTDRYLRLAAEYDNYRKRSIKEREALFGDVRSDTITKLLPVYDNLARALLVTTEDKAFYKGVEMTMTQLKSILEKLGVTEIKAVGETFDPALHSAVMHVEDETHGKDEIVEEYEKGFMLGDKVIRFSTVKVAN